MTQRMFLSDADPKAFKIMLGFEAYLAQSSLQKIHANLIKIRVSQLNGCSYCIDKHIQEALEAGDGIEHAQISSRYRVPRDIRAHPDQAARLLDLDCP